MINTGLDGAEVGESAAQPALIDIIHAAALGFRFDRFLGLFLGADEENGAAVSHDLFDKFLGFDQQFDRLLQVNDMNAITFGEDIFLHPGMPTAGLMTEMSSGFQ